MADPRNQAQQQQSPKTKILARCGERVLVARLRSDFGSAYLFGSSTVLVADGAGRDGCRVTAMALHPAGLAVLHQGKRFVIPAAHVEFSSIAEDEQ